MNFHKSQIGKVMQKNLINDCEITHNCLSSEKEKKTNLVNYKTNCQILMTKIPPTKSLEKKLQEISEF